VSALRRAAGWLLLAAAAAGVPLAQRRIDALRGPFAAHQESLYLWSGAHVKRLFPGFENVAADLYWIRTVQYFGGTRLFSSDRNFALLEPLIDITVTLDPRFDIAYRYGAVFLSEPSGAGRPRSGIALLERGARANPSNWRLKKELGYFYFVFLHDPQNAARVLLEAADVPGAAWWLRTMAADVLGRGGDRATARRIWAQMYEEEEQGPLKRNALVNVQMIDALELRDRLQALADQFARRAGRHPHALQELVEAGLAARVPADPTGVPFQYDAATGRVAIARRSTLWRPDR
jgi:hypothetical protein